MPSILPVSVHGDAKPHDDMARENKTTEGLRRASLGTSSVSSSTESLAVPPSYSPTTVPVPGVSMDIGNQQFQDESGHRRIDVNDAKNNNVHRDPGPLEIAFTVLRSCPLHDTLAILIILMQVSPVALTTIYMLFTFLTFVPPVTTSSGLSITEIFDNQGTPSLTTLLGMDVGIFFGWLFLWGPLQQFIVDLAQVVISLTLGGGGSSRRGPTNNILLCVAIVSVSQWTRHVKWPGLSTLKRLLGSEGPFPSDQVGPLDFSSTTFEKKGPYGWIRSVLAIHILTQGLVRYIREWYLRREKRDLQAQSQLDPEAAKPPAFAVDSSADGGFGTTDMDATSPQPGLLLPLTSKRRRKQSAQVRIRQPLWAALASTKIVMVKEYELSHAASESAGSNATDIHNLGNAPFNTQPEQIWICYVGCDEVCFNTSFFPNSPDAETHGRGGSEQDNKSGVDMTKPFYVRVNHAVWQPTRIMPVGGGCDEERTAGATWTGDIYGLTPMSNYECEFVSTRTGEVIFSTRVRTHEAKSRDPESQLKAATIQRSTARHDSPETTMRASITNANAKLADEKARLKTARKDHNRKVNAARKEIEKLTSVVQSAGGNDDKLRQKVVQNNIQQRQAEQSIAQLEVELRDYDMVPEELLVRYRAKHSAYTSEKEMFDGAKASFNSFKASIDAEIKAGEEEKTSLQAKRNKIAARISKVDNELARITDANARGLGEAERRRQERQALEAEAARTEQSLTERLHTSRAINADKQLQIQTMAEHMRTYLSSMQEDYPYDAAVSAAAHAASHYAPSPWALSTGAAGQYQQPSMWPTAPATMAAIAAPVFPPTQLNHLPFHPLQTTHGMATPPPIKTRGRSSSMLSDVSGFTQSTNEDDRPIHDNKSATFALQEQPSVHFGLQSSAGTRSPPGFNFPRIHHQHQEEGSGSGSALGSNRTSVSGDSSSVESNRDVVSPI